MFDFHGMGIGCFHWVLLFLDNLILLPKHNWQNTVQRIVKWINDLFKDIFHTPFTGIGKPEPLKCKYKGFWSRWIDGEHRLIYQVREDEILIIKCRFHYEWI